MVNTLNTKTHSSKEMDEFSVKNADAKSICYCQQRMKSKLSLSSECVETKLHKLCTSFTSHLHSLCGTVRYTALGVNPLHSRHNSWKVCKLALIKGRQCPHLSRVTSPLKSTTAPFSNPTAIRLRFSCTVKHVTWVQDKKMLDDYLYTQVSKKRKF